jgi:hypothetical protein
MKAMLMVGAVAASHSVVSVAVVLDFEADTPGGPPKEWTIGVTGSGAPKWTVEADATAPGVSHVLRQSGVGTFPWAVRKDVSFADGTAEVRFKPIAGKEDEAGGVVWRWKDGDNYYVARANALENNVSLYYTKNGQRSTIKYVNAPVARGAWHTLKVDFTGSHITVALDWKTYIEAHDEHIRGSGAVGVWTKADSVTSFAWLRYEPKT